MAEHTQAGATVYTDEHTGYKGLTNPHETVKHSVGEWVNGLAHTNGMESFWSMLKRGYHGVYHRLSPKHLQAYVNTFAGRHNLRDLDTADQIRHVVAAMVGKRLMYRDLVAPSDRSSAAT
ncbi:MAG: transposase [Gemmatimonadota bacterium]|nr:transposase [Gemmatimonadota bacterium]